MSKFCTSCGKELAEGAAVCSQCGAPVEGANPTVSVQPTTTVVATEAPKKGNGMAIAGLIISIVSLVFCCGSLSVISLIFSILGLSAAKKANGNGKGMAVAGTIISAIGIVILVIFSILITIGALSIPDEIEDLENYNSYSTYSYDS